MNYLSTVEDGGLGYLSTDPNAPTGGAVDLSAYVGDAALDIAAGPGDENSVDITGGTGIDGGEGGYAALTGGNGDTGEQGGGASLQGGGANGGADVNKLGAAVTAAGGNMGGHGKVTIQTDGSQGEAGQVFTADGAGAATWEDAAAGGGGGDAAFSGAKIYATGVQAIPSATFTAVTFDGEEYDDGGYFDGAHPTRLTALVTGKYRLTGYSNWATGPTAGIIQFYRNGTSPIRSQAVVPGVNVGIVNTVDVALAAGDYVEMRVFHSSAGSANIGDAANVEQQTTFSIAMLAGVAIAASGSTVLDMREYVLGADVPIVTSGTYVDGPSGTPPAGRYAVFYKAHFTVTSGGQSHEFNARLLAGATILDEAESDTGQPTTALGFMYEVSGFAGNVVLDGATPLKLVATDIRSGASTLSKEANASGAGGGSGTATRILAIRQVSGSTVFAGAKVYATATQAINNTTAAVTFDSEEWDSDGYHEAVTHPTRITVPAGKAGKYHLAGGAFFSGSGQWLGFRLNGTTAIRGYHSEVGGVYGQVQADVALVAGDYVEMLATTGGNVTVGHATLPDAQSWVSATLIGGAPASGSSGARVTRSADQSVGDNTLTAISFTAENYDTDGYHDNSSNPTRLTIPTAGLYSFKASGYANINTGDVDCQFRVNGTPIGFNRQKAGTVVGGYSSAVDWFCAAGDYVECFVRATGGAASVIFDVGSSPVFSVARLVDGVPAPAPFMGATAWNSVAQSIPNATDTVVTLDSEEADTGAIHSIASATSRFTVPVGGAGRWAGLAYIPWASNAGGTYRYIWWKKNGTRILGSLTSSPAEAGPGQDQQNALRPILLAEGDYLEAEVRQDTGGALNIGISGDQRVVVAVWRVA